MEEIVRYVLFITEPNGGQSAVDKFPECERRPSRLTCIYYFLTDDKRR